MTDVPGGQIPLVYTAVAGAHGHCEIRQVARDCRVQRAAHHGPARCANFPGKRRGRFLGRPAGARQHAAAILGGLNAELNAPLNDPAVREQCASWASRTTPGSAAQFREEMRRDLARYGPVVKTAGIVLE
jgi:hypothetical protein